MKRSISFREAAAYGFHFPGARAWLDTDSRGNITNARQLAQDAALITSPNATVPAEFLAYIDPQVIEILTAPRRAREIFAEEKRGDWTTPYFKWALSEHVGSTQPYSDYANGTTSDINVEWATRQQYVFQTSITYGDYELAMSGEAKINLAAEKQRAAATVLDIDANRFYLLGVDGREIYGLLNDPNLPAAITAAPVGTGGSPLWSTKNTQQIYDDVRMLFAELVRQSRGNITQDMPLKLVLSPEMSVSLGAATDFNISAYDMMMKFFRNLTIVTLPELSSPTAGETMLMIADKVQSVATGFLGYGDKMRAGRIVPDLSSFSQKFVGTTYGGIYRRPFAVAQMTGI